MTIKMKILFPMIILTVLVAVAILCSNILQFSNYVDTTMEDRVNAAAAVAANELEMLKSQANSASLYIAEDPVIMTAIEQGSHNALLNHIQQLQNETGVDFCAVTDAAGIVLARSHDPQNIGDDLSSKDCISHALSGRSFTVIAESSDISLSVRSGTPVLNSQGELVGVVSTGFRLDTNTFVDSIKELLGCEVTIFLGDERLSTTVVKEDGKRAVGTKAAAEVSATVLAGNSYGGQAQILGRDALTRYNPILGSNDKVLGMLFVGRYMNEKTDTVWSFVQMGLLITLILLAISIPIILFIVRRITAPIKAMVKAANALAVGDTGIGVQVNTKDEMRELGSAFNNIIENNQKQIQLIEDIAAGNLTVDIKPRSEKDILNISLEKMIDHLNDIFGEIHASANQVSTGSKQIADGAQSLAQGSTEQASAIEELSASISEIANKTLQNAGVAREAADLSGAIKDSAEKGSAQMERMMWAVREINEASSQISKVIKVIDDIAFQTNILALNAAVEAARAGQHGKGFAVVADEVRNLAAKSAEAAKDTGGLIENSIEKANFGLNIATETSASLKGIVEGINHSTEIVVQIARSSDEQAGAIARINTGIDHVAQVVQQNSATAEESAAASEEMSGQSDMLEQLISQFKLKDSERSHPFGNPSRRKALAMPVDNAFALTVGSSEYGNY